MKTIKQIFLISILMLFTMGSSFAVTPWDNEVERTIKVSDFSKIYIEGNFKILLEQSNQPSLRIEADENDFEHIEINQKSGKLSIVRENFDLESATLYISFRNLNELILEGGIKLETSGYLDLADILIHVEGGAKIEMGLKADDVEVSGEGGVYIELKGVADELSAQISGAGYLESEDLKCEDVKIKIEGVGAASVYATNNLDAGIEGVGKIKYKGNPKVEKHVEGIGDISDK